MDAISALHGRISIATLGQPGPTSEQLDTMLRAAVRAPDHGVLRPWRFIVLQGSEREALGDIFVQACLRSAPDSDTETLEKMRRAPLRAPMVVVVIAETDPDNRIPLTDQLLAAGAAAQNIMLAAHALGLGGMWRTGDMAKNTLVKERLGFAEKDEIIGFLYLGTPTGSIKRVPANDPARYLRALPQ